MTKIRWARAAAVGLALAITAPLAACAGSEPAADGPTKITFWNWYQGADGPTLEKLVDEFNASQDDVIVDMTVMPKDTMIQKLLPAYAAGDGPTLAAVAHEMVAQYSTKGAIQPVDDFYGEGKLEEDVLPKATLDAVTIDGVKYGAPMSTAPMMLYYNKTLFAEAGLDGPPESMDELWEDAQAITQYTEGANATNIYGIAQGTSGGIHTWITFFRNEGGGYVSEDRTTSILDSQSNIDELTKLADLFRNGHISPINMTVSDADALFAAGRAGMMINGPWASGGYAAAGVDYGVVPIPAGSEDQTTVVVGTPIIVAAGISDAERAAAQTFLTYWNSVENQTAWALGTGYPPTRSDIDPSALESNPIPGIFTTAVGAESHMRGVVNFQTIIDDVVVPTISRVLDGKGTPAELLPEASKQLQQLLDEK
ncbi:ABC transporter substrate-binding protein [Schumannella luteola]